MEVVRYHPALDAEWDAFIETRANNGTLFHKRAFLAYHPPDRFVDDSLLFYKRGELQAVLPAASWPDHDGQVLISHPGASFGGLATRPELSLRDATTLVQQLKKYALAQEYAALDMTLPPIVYCQKPSNYIDFALYNAGFRYRKREISSVVALDVDEAQVLRLFKPEARRAVRRSQKLGVTIREDDDFVAFYDILQHNLKLRHNVSPTHSLAELQKLVGLFPEKIKLFAAFAEAQMIAGIVLFRATAKTTLAFYISHIEAFQKYRAVNHLFYEVFRWCIRNRFRFLDFGIFTVNMEPNWGLARFKESFGAQGVFRDSMRLKLS